MFISRALCVFYGKEFLGGEMHEIGLTKESSSKTYLFPLLMVLNVVAAEMEGIFSNCAVK